MSRVFGVQCRPRTAKQRSQCPVVILDEGSMAFTDVLPLRATGIASCSGRPRLRHTAPERGAAAVVRAQHRQQPAHPQHASRAAVSLALGVVQQQLMGVAPAVADDMAAYDASGVSDSIKNAFGVAYVAVLIGFGIRLFNKRAKRFTTEVRVPVPSPLVAFRSHPRFQLPHSTCCIRRVS